MTKRFGRWLKRALLGEPLKRRLGATGWPRPNAVKKFRFETEERFRVLIHWDEDAEFVGPGWLLASEATIEHWLDTHKDAVELPAVA